jgi:hypothetical protein
MEEIIKMAHYAFLDSNNIVTQVIVGKDEDDLPEGITSWEEYYGNLKNQVCKRTSYNTRAGEHTEGGTPFRGNYAGIGYVYNEELDAFIPPQPFASWTLNDSTYSWDAPVAYPEDGELYVWNESAGNWEIATPGE